MANPCHILFGYIRMSHSTFETFNRNCWRQDVLHEGSLSTCLGPKPSPCLEKLTWPPFGVRELRSIDKLISHDHISHWGGLYPSDCIPLLLSTPFWRHGQHLSSLFCGQSTLHSLGAISHTDQDAQPIHIRFPFLSLDVAFSHLRRGKCTCLSSVGDVYAISWCSESEVGLEIEKEPFDWGHSPCESAFRRPVTTKMEVPRYLLILHSRFSRRVMTSLRNLKISDFPPSLLRISLILLMVF